VFTQCVNELSTAKDQQSYEEAKKRIRKIAAKATANLNSGQVKLEDMIYTVKLYFDPNEKIEGLKAAHQPYQCAVQLIDAGRKLKRGDTISFIKVKPFKYRGRNFTVKPAEFVTHVSEINPNDYVRNLLAALNQTFEPMGIKLEDVKDARISEWLSR
jgi:DNA polymerase elongation subunit (family B)